jgi:uncharacterized protein
MLTRGRQGALQLVQRSILPSDVPMSPEPLQGVVVKLASRCNLNCDYCYWFRDSDVMSSPARLTLEAEHAFLARLDRHVRRHKLDRFVIGLHGGEPLLFGLARFHGLMTSLRKLEQETGCALEVHITTNGVLVDDDWAALLRTHRVLVGVSIDGPPSVHDVHRVDLIGRSTHERVIGGIATLRSWGIEPGVLAVCDPESDPAELLHHLVDDLEVLHFDVLVPDARHGDNPPSIANYYKRLFDLWFDDYSSRGVRVRFLEAAVRGLFGAPGGVDAIGFGPVTIVTLTTDGSIEVHDVCRIAEDGSNNSPVSVLTHDLDDMLEDPRWRQVFDASVNLPEACRACEWQYACGGGHVASRWSTERGFDNPSVYCDDYKKFFAHAHSRVVGSLFVEPVEATSEERRLGV